MSTFEQIELEYFLYPIYKDITATNVALLFKDGIPITKSELSRRRNNSWIEGKETDEKLKAASQPFINPDSTIKGFAVIQIPKMFLFGLEWQICKEKGLQWQGFMPYLKKTSSYSSVPICIIPILVQGIYSCATSEWHSNPEQSIYWRGDGLLFDDDQIKQMEWNSCANVARAARYRENAPSFEFLKLEDQGNATFKNEGIFFQGILFSPAYKAILTKKKK